MIGVTFGSADLLMLAAIAVLLGFLVFLGAAEMALSSEGLFADMASESRSGKPKVGKETGAGTAPGGRTVEANYESPMLAHATMEPQNAVVSVTADRCEIWLGTQVPTRVVAAAAAITGQGGVLPDLPISLPARLLGLR